MDALLSFITQPWIIVLIAIGVFVGRVFMLARRLRSAARHPTLADLRALEDAKKSLDEHHRSIDGARETLSKNLGGARDTLRHYKGPYAAAVEGRKEDLESAMTKLGDFHKPLEKAREEPKAALKKGLKDAKNIYKSTIPRNPRHAPKDI